ncbi:MAG: PAS domain-containing protein [Nitriliruptor sp.]
MVATDDASWRLAALDRLVATTPSTVAVVRSTGADAVIELLDPHTSAALGDGSGSLVGRSVSSLLRPHDLAEMLAQLERARDAGDVEHEVTRDLPTGRRTWEVRISSLDDDRYVIVARDVSEHRRDARRIEQLEHLAGIGVYHWNVRDGVVTWSDQLYRLFGYEPGEVEITLDRFLSHVHPDDVATQERLIERSRREARAFTTTLRIVRVDGEERSIEVRTEAAADGERLLYTLGTMQDVTERLESQRNAELLRQASARRRTGLEVHDRIVQGLATAWLALQLGDHDQALAAIASTTENAQAVVRGLLADIGSGDGAGPGDLVSRADHEAEVDR